MGWMSAICDAHKKVVVELLFNSVKTGSQLVWRPDEMETGCGRESQHPERLIPQAPCWAAQENGKETRLWPIEWRSISCSSVRFPTPSHTQPFQIKWEVYFSKNCVARLYCAHRYYCVVMILHAYVDVYVLCVCVVGHGHGYKTDAKQI